MTYTRLQGWFGSDYWVREDANGSLWAYDPNSQQEMLWYAFQNPLGSLYSESAPIGCCGQATILSTSAGYQGPVGSYNTALEIDYPGATAQGTTREWFLAYVGLVSRGQSVGQPTGESFDLIYSRIGGVTVVSRPELAATLSLDHAVYLASSSPVLVARLSIRNTTADPAVLVFNSSQIYDLEIRDDNGNVVYQWSNGKAFSQVATTLVIQDEQDYIIMAPLVNLAAGAYTAESWFVTAGSPGNYAASVGFQIQ